MDKQTKIRCTVEQTDDQVNLQMEGQICTYISREINIQNGIQQLVILFLNIICLKGSTDNAKATYNFFPLVQLIFEDGFAKVVCFNKRVLDNIFEER